MHRKHICVFTPCYNEAENVRQMYNAIRDEFSRLSGYTWEHLLIDNASTDGTQQILREMAAEHANVKVIFNTRNFGHIRSPWYGFLQGEADATICLASDFQDPPSLIPQFIRKWEEGFKMVIGVKESSSESPLMFMIRRSYYSLITRLSSIELVKNTTGCGLYDREVVHTLRKIDDPYPYSRGLFAEVGYESAKVVYHQPGRRRGITKNNFYTLYDIAMLGIVNHSRIPLRLATMAGFVMAAASFLMALVYLALKLIFWNRFGAGTAPILIGLLLFSSVQLFFIGLLGEYIGAIHTQVQKRPLVIERERLNWPSTAINHYRSDLAKDTLTEGADSSLAVA